MPDLTHQDRIKSAVAIVGDCWEWQLHLSSNGYGKLGIDGKTVRAHRFSYEAFIGPIGDSWVLHKCDNRRCCNPDHLFLGTPTDNVRDMIAKGRAGQARRGELNGRAKLTAEQIPYVRAEAARRGNSAVARELGVSEFAVRAVVKGKLWKHV